MVAERKAPVTASEISLLPYTNQQQLCPQCETPVQSMRTYDGRHRTFEATAIPTRLDPDREGWVPGAWTVNGHRHVVLAPLSHYPTVKRTRVTHVVVPHRCPIYLAARAERAAQ